MNAIRRKEQLKFIDTGIDINVNMMSSPYVNHDQLIRSLDKELAKRYKTALHDMVGIKKEEERIKQAKAKGLTGDSDVDQMLKMHKILTKLGYIKP